LSGVGKITVFDTGVRFAAAIAATALLQSISDS
jgi:hypothetical protein